MTSIVSTATGKIQPRIKRERKDLSSFMREEVFELDDDQFLVIARNLGGKISSRFLKVDHRKVAVVTGTLVASPHDNWSSLRHIDGIAELDAINPATSQHEPCAFPVLEEVKGGATINTKTQAPALNIVWSDLTIRAPVDDEAPYSLPVVAVGGRVLLVDTPIDLPNLKFVGGSIDLGWNAPWTAAPARVSASSDRYPEARLGLGWHAAIQLGRHHLACVDAQQDAIAALDSEHSPLSMPGLSL